MTDKKKIVRFYDQIILDLIVNILDNGTLVIETFNEAVLVKLLELRGTPIKVAKSYRDIEKDFAKWEEENKKKAEDVLFDLEENQ